MKIVELSREDRLALARKVLADWRASRGRDTVVTTGDVGSQILSHIERAFGHDLICGTCRQYLVSLNSDIDHDADVILAKLSAVMVLPPHISEIHNTQQKRSEWLRDIVTTALLEWVQT